MVQRGFCILEIDAMVEPNLLIDVLQYTYLRVVDYHTGLKMIIQPHSEDIKDTDEQGPDFDDMSSFFPCEIDEAIQCINLGYGAQTQKIVIL